MSLKPEQILQINLINWFKHEWPELSKDIHHIANERKCSDYQGKILQKMGVTPGFSDIFIAIPNNGFHGLLVELKTDKGKLTVLQSEFLYNKNQRGYFAIAVWGLESAQEVIKTYLKDYNE